MGSALDHAVGGRPKKGSGGSQLWKKALLHSSLCFVMGFFTGFAIAGGAFYPASGTFAAPYRGNYFFADFLGKFIGRLDLANDVLGDRIPGQLGHPLDGVQ